MVLIIDIKFKSNEDKMYVNKISSSLSFAETTSRQSIVFTVKEFYSTISIELDNSKKTLY